MMEASETVMTWKQIAECSHNPVLELRERDICLGQAEITWPIAFKVGIEEVVEWIEEMAKNRRRTTKHKVNYITISHKTWQAKLKDWGVD